MANGKPMRASALKNDDAPPVRRNADGSERVEQLRTRMTCAALIAAGREMFGRLGYHAVNTGEIAIAASVTRGALYYHFATKEELFEAVYCSVAQELSDKVSNDTSHLSGQTWRRVIANIRLHLKYIAASSEIQRILLIDGPSVLGWERYNELKSLHRLGGWNQTLKLLMDKGELETRPVEPLAYLLMGAFDTAALGIAQSPNPRKSQEAVTEALIALIGGLRAQGSATEDKD